MSRLKRESVQHIMTKELQTISVKTPLSTVGKIFGESGFHHLPVLSGKKLIGMVSFLDLMRVNFADSFGVDKNQAVYEVLDRTLSVEDIMSKDLVTLESTKTIQDAAELLAEGSYHALPVVADGELVGIVTSADLLKYLLKQY